MNLSTVLLAGGESRRMGQDKATMLFRAKPLWEHQLETLRRLQPAQIFVSARADPVWRPPDVEFLRDEPPSRGPLSGIAAVLARITTSHLLAFAVDVPLMTPEYLRSLVTRVVAGRGAIPMIDNRAEPLAAIYPREAVSEISFALSTADFSLQAVARALIGVGKLAPVVVAAAEELLFRNVNEPADLAVQ